MKFTLSFFAIAALLSTSSVAAQIESTVAFDVLSLDKRAPPHHHRHGGHGDHGHGRDHGHGHGRDHEHGHGHGHGHGNGDGHGHGHGHTPKPPSGPRSPACKASKCTNSIPAHSHRVCDDSHKCNFNCDRGFAKKNGVCTPSAAGPNYKACKASKCHRHLPRNSHAICKMGECSYACDLGFRPKGGKCVKSRTHCKKSSQCARTTPHSFPACIYGKCGTICSTGYALEGTKCVPNGTTCGTSACDTITNGGVKCVNGSCKYSCRPTFTLETSSGKAQCLRLSRDPHNCGSVGHACPSDYTGSGTPQCSNGKCRLRCPFGTRPLQNPSRCG